jgi:hypothetical protein
MKQPKEQQAPESRSLGANPPLKAGPTRYAGRPLSRK